MQAANQALLLLALAIPCAAQVPRSVTSAPAPGSQAIGATLSGNPRRAGTPPLPVIFDTDYTADVDDVAAAALLATYHQRKKIRLLAMSVSTGNHHGVMALRAQNRLYGLQNVVVGMYGDKKFYNEKQKWQQHLLKNYATDATPAFEAYQVYRWILHQHYTQGKGKTIVFVFTGFLTNLDALLQSQGDWISPLSGKELLRHTTFGILMMGGNYPSQRQGVRDWNFGADPRGNTNPAQAAQRAIASLPSDPKDQGAVLAVFVGAEEGDDVFVGKDLPQRRQDNFIRQAFFKFPFDAFSKGRPAWDVIAAYLLDGEGEHFDIIKQGHNHVFYNSANHPDGFNEWRTGTDKTHWYVKQKLGMDKEALERELHHLVFSARQDGVTTNAPAPHINLAHTEDAKVSGSLIPQGYGSPEDILYDPLTETYVTDTPWAAWGCAWHHNLGLLTRDDPFFWSVTWPQPKRMSEVCLGGPFRNPYLANARYEFQYKHHIHTQGLWHTLSSGTGGWLANEGVLHLQTPPNIFLAADGLRLIIYSDGISPIISPHLRGTGAPTSQLMGQGANPIKSGLIRYLK